MAITISLSKTVVLNLVFGDAAEGLRGFFVKPTGKNQLRKVMAQGAVMPFPYSAQRKTVPMAAA
jgi:hypothetical protein